MVTTLFIFPNRINTLDNNARSVEFSVDESHYFRFIRYKQHLSVVTHAVIECSLQLSKKTEDLVPNGALQENLQENLPL